MGMLIHSVSEAECRIEGVEAGGVTEA